MASLGSSAQLRLLDHTTVFVCFVVQIRNLALETLGDVHKTA